MGSRSWKIGRKCVPWKRERTFWWPLWNKETRTRKPIPKRGIRLIKKVSGLLEAKQEGRFQFLKEHKNKLNIRRVCQTLYVSNAGFYEFLKGKPSKKRENELLKEEIAIIFQEHHGRYGAIRITKGLNKKGILVHRKRVGKLLNQLGLYAKDSTYKY